MNYEYKRVYLRTVEEIEKAERLQSRGWKAIAVIGIDYILMQKQVVQP